MGMLFMFLLLIVNFGISCWNAYVTGRVWAEARSWLKVVAWTGLIMSACGFVMVSAVVLGFISLAAGWIDNRGLQALLSLNYLLIIVPVLGSGIIITIHSWIEAYRRRDFASIGTAAWNTYAQGSNTYGALNGGMSSAFGNVSDFFKSDNDSDGKDAAGKAVILLILLVAMLIAGGLTYTFFQIGRRADVRQLHAQPVARREPSYR